ncbi:MAG TPA: hypothetical protein VJ551_02940, partial [Nitrososphaeraceae archaeon]|nr:hypothetical protein [Nitrososphaeraceae archaeon]
CWAIVGSGMVTSVNIHNKMARGTFQIRILENGRLLILFTIEGRPHTQIKLINLDVVILLAHYTFK